MMTFTSMPSNECDKSGSIKTFDDDKEKDVNIVIDQI